ncbi:MAG TPA: UDP-N-acetylmuramoyl-L-alanine--D-glutamate ligase [Terriglobales bacterium]|nr:UDP-N-acetylmuramoyl-L-alanine--D-glutamate ligase [Terriglobales bacterium]
MSFSVAGRRLLLIGAGVTGESVARFLAGRGASLRLVEQSAERLEKAALPEGVETSGDDTSLALLTQVDAVIPSPGVACAHPLLQAAVRSGIPVLSEIELASRFLRCPLIAITGTNGKSTTTTLLGAMYRAAGKRVFVGGNLGVPMIDACAAEPAFQAAVVEVSSFQLEWVTTFRPTIAVLLNLTPDHLDRYPSMSEYQEAKAALLRVQQPEDWAVLNRDDAWVWQQRQRTRARVVSFGADPVEFGTYIEGDEVIVAGSDAAPHRFDLRRTALQGAHNRQNIMAAATAAVLADLPDAAIQKAIDTTAGLPHRLALVRERDGVRYFDDSKGTNSGAVAQSLASFASGVVLLAGGYDKGGDFRELLPLLRSRCRCVVAFGAAADLIERQLSSEIRVIHGGTLEQAVPIAAAEAQPGEVVLLSPGCASFDEFRNYAERGDKFRQWVEAL